MTIKSFTCSSVKIIVIGLLNLVKHQRPDIDKIYLYVKDPFESNNQLLINGRGKVGIENLEI